MEQLQAGHRARLDGSILQNFNKDSVQFREVLPNRPPQRPQQPQQQPQQPQQQIPESYLNYAAQLLEQMRGVYGSSWDNCGCGSSWHGGHNHFYDPCSGADAAPPSCGCPVFDCTILYRQDQNHSRLCLTAVAALRLITMIAPTNCSSCATS